MSNRAILFDLYETLVTERDSNPTRASSLGTRLGFDVQAFREAWKPLRTRVVRGELSFSSALLEVGATLDQHVDPTLSRSLSHERRLEKSGVLRHIGADALAALRHLKEFGYGLAVVSNCFAEDVTDWRDCPASEYFDATAFSCAVGAAKPEPLVYLETLRRLGVDSGEAVFIGDGGDDELLGAERVGVRAAQATWFCGERSDLPQYIPRLTSWSAVVAFAQADHHQRRVEEERGHIRRDL